MKCGLTILTTAAASLAVLLIGAAPAQAADAKTTFTELKCNSCHAIASQGVKAVEEEVEEGEEPAKPSDLSNVGATRSASWIKDWLNKKVDVDGKKHRKKFEGTGEQLNSLATWLASLKEPAK